VISLWLVKFRNQKPKGSAGRIALSAFILKLAGTPPFPVPVRFLGLNAAICRRWKFSGPPGRTALYSKWRQSRRPGLKVIDPPIPSPPGGGVITRNDLGFEGEERFGRFTKPLDRLLASWLAGDTGFPVAEAFPFDVPAPLTPPDLAPDRLDGYARNRDVFYVKVHTKL
jgi:hypothetical protein